MLFRKLSLYTGLIINGFYSYTDINAVIWLAELSWSIGHSKLICRFLVHLEHANWLKQVYLNQNLGYDHINLT